MEKQAFLETVSQEQLTKALMEKPRCDRCQCWTRFAGEVMGRCNAMPPTPFSNGHTACPTTRESDRCIHLFKALPIGVDPVVKTKNQPASPAQAARDKRLGK
jgi:hypothetical protein